MAGPGLRLVGESVHGSFLTCCLYFYAMVPVDNGRLAVQTMQRLSREDGRTWETGDGLDRSFVKTPCTLPQYFYPVRSSGADSDVDQSDQTQPAEHTSTPSHDIHGLPTTTTLRVPPCLRGVAVWVLVDQEPPMYEGDDGAFCDDWPSEGIWLEGEEQDESRAVDYDADPPR